MCLNFKLKLSTAFHPYHIQTVLSDILSVISLRLLHETPFNAILLNICAICSNRTWWLEGQSILEWVLFFRLQADLVLCQPHF